jgi:hypothetical protein
MLSPFHERFGWSDSVGPLWFLRPRWSGGLRWRPTWLRFFASPSGVTCQAHGKESGYAVDGFYVPWVLWNDLSYLQKEEVVMSWVSRNRRSPGAAAGPPVSHDAEWSMQLPAIHEYMVLLRHEDGSARRTATLTVFADTGSWKVFLNDRDSGTSLCASGPSVNDALGALEVMLEGENPPWRLCERQGEASGRKRPPKA